jgi:hypothetical protein
VAELEVGELTCRRVGGERGEVVAVEVGEPPLRPGVRPFIADDDPHPGRPGGKVEQPGDVGDPGAVAGLPAPSQAGVHEPAGTFRIASCTSSLTVMPTE